eukprot:scaffold7235_cov22-Tisochrysis_lutea.AAC.6
MHCTIQWQCALFVIQSNEQAGSGQGSLCGGHNKAPGQGGGRGAGREVVGIGCMKKGISQGVNMQPTFTISTASTTAPTSSRDMAVPTTSMWALQRSWTRASAPAALHAGTSLLFSDAAVALVCVLSVCCRMRVCCTTRDFSCLTSCAVCV